MLRGGYPHSYDESLKSGGRLLSLLREMEEGYEPIDIFISKDGEWHVEGLVYEPHRALSRADIVWSTLHHNHHREGEPVQRILENLKIPFAGSGAATFSLALNRDMARKLYDRASLPTLRHEIVTESNFSNDLVLYIFRNYLLPVVIKPVNIRSGVDAFIVHGFNELKEKIKEALSLSERVLVEESVKGVNATCVVIEHARGQSVYALLPSAGSGQSLRSEEMREIERLSGEAHRALGLRHYSASHFLVTPRGKIYIMETDPSPAIHEESFVHSSLNNTGWKHRDFVKHILNIVER